MDREEDSAAPATQAVATAVAERPLGPPASQDGAHPLLDVRDLSKAFPGVQALSGVSLSLDAGEILALVGENGAGKSTLIKILTGLYQADSGSIQIAGEPAAPHSPQDAIARGIAVRAAGTQPHPALQRRREHLPRRAAEGPRHDRLRQGPRGCPALARPAGAGCRLALPGLQAERGADAARGDRPGAVARRSHPAARRAHGVHHARGDRDALPGPAAAAATTAWAWSS